MRFVSLAAIAFFKSDGRALSKWARKSPSILRNVNTAHTLQIRYFTVFTKLNIYWFDRACRLNLYTKNLQKSNYNHILGIVMNAAISTFFDFKYFFFQRDFRCILLPGLKV